MTKARILRTANTVLSFGLNLVIEKLGLNPKLRYAVWGLIAANEIRGLVMVYQIGGSALQMSGAL